MDEGSIHELIKRGREKLASDTLAMPALLKGRVPRQAAKKTDSSFATRPLQVKAGLEPYTQSLDAKKARHLLRRTHLGATIDQVNALIGSDASQAVDDIIAGAIDTVATPFPEEPAWANEVPPFGGTQEELDAFIENNIMWLYELQDEWFSLLTSLGFRERMTLFWHNHFVTQYDDYFLAMHAYRYLKLLREHAFGNLKDFVHAIGTDPAMLEYLDSNTNQVGEPNENYGRELLELFTMSPKDKDGNDNYSQQDIVEAARALTGWIIDFLNHVGFFVNARFDDGEKTFLGQTGNWGYDDIIDIIFAERGFQTAYFVCEKLYKEFVYAVPDPTIVDELATEMVNQDYEILPVVEKLLKSAHFFDDAVVGARIKSPIELLAGMPKEIGRTLNDEQVTSLRQIAGFLEQNILNPPNVAGWPGHRTWVSTTSLPIRLLLSDFLLFGENGENLTDLVSVAVALPEASGQNAAFDIPVALAEYLLPIPLDTLDIGTVTEEFGGDLVNFPIPDEVLNGPSYAVDLAKIFLAGVPWYEWDMDSEIAPILLVLFARFITQRPEFHLV